MSVKRRTLPEAPTGILKTPPLATDRLLDAGDAPRLAQPTCPDMGGVAPPILSGLLTCLWSEQAECGRVSAMMARLGNL